MPAERYFPAQRGCRFSLYSREGSCQEAKSELEKEFYRHLPPPSPIVLGIISPDVEKVRNRPGMKDSRKPEVLVPVDVLLARRQHHVQAPVPAQIPFIGQVRQKIGR